ncbi:MAG: hypothetical protein ACE3JP_14015, partial [Ectobacillus sp.]
KKTKQICKTASQRLEDRVRSFTATMTWHNRQAVVICSNYKLNFNAVPSISRSFMPIYRIADYWFKKLCILAPKGI